MSARGEAGNAKKKYRKTAVERLQGNRHLRGGTARKKFQMYTHCRESTGIRGIGKSHNAGEFAGGAGQTLGAFGALKGHTTEG